MTSTIRKVSTLTAVLLAFSTAGMASLLSPNATFGFIPLGGALAISPGNDLLAATSVTLPSSELINTVPSTAFGIANDFDGATPLLTAGNSLVLNPLTISLTSGPVSLPDLISFPSSTGRFDFSASSEVVSFSAATRSVSALFLGTFHDTTAGGFSDAPASVTFSFNQSAANTATNDSATFSTPPQAVIASVPEPGSLFLLSSALVGLVLFGRKRFAR
jgi:hypothetical protein